MDILDESNKHLEKLLEAQNAFRENSAARGEVGKYIAELSGEFAGIAELLKKIEGISTQINLLSVNASIEAARAGNEGLGFAVVAQEIGSLSKNTSETVKDIDVVVKSINEIMNKTKNNMSNAKKIGAEFDNELDACINSAKSLDKTIKSTI